MSDYERLTVLPSRDVLAKAAEIFPDRAELTLAHESGHGVSYSGGEGTVDIEVHRHGFSTQVVVRTDRLRTSKVDGVVRYFMNQLPYQNGDPGRE